MCHRLSRLGPPLNVLLAPHLGSVTVPVTHSFPKVSLILRGRWWCVPPASDSQTQVPWLRGPCGRDVLDDAMRSWVVTSPSCFHRFCEASMR